MSEYTVLTLEERIGQLREIIRQQEGQLHGFSLDLKANQRILDVMPPSVHAGIKQGLIQIRQKRTAAIAALEVYREELSALEESSPPDAEPVPSGGEE